MVISHFTKDKTNNFENILRPIDENLWEVRELDLFALGHGLGEMEIPP